MGTQALVFLKLPRWLQDAIQFKDQGYNPLSPAAHQGHPGAFKLPKAKASAPQVFRPSCFEVF